MMTDDEDYERRILEMQDRIATMSDAEVKQAYEATDGEPGDAWVDALANAPQERNIDVLARNRANLPQTAFCETLYAGSSAYMT